MAFLYSKANLQPINRPQRQLDRLIEMVLDHGHYAFQSLIGNNTNQELLSHLIQSGLIQLDSNHSYQPTPRFLQECETMAFHHLRLADSSGLSGGHGLSRPGIGDEELHGVRFYQPGDRPDRIDWLGSIRQSIRNTNGRPELKEKDLLVWDEEESTDCATVILLDLSGSMNRYGKFTRARQVTLAMQKLVRSCYPEDLFQVIGFATLPKQLTGLELLLESPRSVNLIEEQGRRRYSRENEWALIPGHYTNLQAGLMEARQWLVRQGKQHLQIICITDGEPTAHLEGNEVVLGFPPNAETMRYTIKEVARCTQKGIRVQFVGLTEDYQVTGLKSILDQLAIVARVPAMVCDTTQLGSIVLKGYNKVRQETR